MEFTFLHLLHGILHLPFKLLWYKRWSWKTSTKQGPINPSQWSRPLLTTPPTTEGTWIFPIKFLENKMTIWMIHKSSLPATRRQTSFKKENLTADGQKANKAKQYTISRRIEDRYFCLGVAWAFRQTFLSKKPQWVYTEQTSLKILYYQESPSHFQKSGFFEASWMGSIWESNTLKKKYTYSTIKFKSIFLNKWTSFITYLILYETKSPIRPFN